MSNESPILIARFLGIEWLNFRKKNLAVRPIIATKRKRRRWKNKNGHCKAFRYSLTQELIIFDQNLEERFQVISLISSNLWMVFVYFQVVRVNWLHGENQKGGRQQVQTHGLWWWLEEMCCQFCLLSSWKGFEQSSG